MRVTLNFEVASRARKNGTYPIYLRATENSIHYKQTLDVYVSDRRNFDPQAKKENWINTKEPFAKVFNSKLSNALLSAHKLALELERREELSAQNLIKSLKGDNSESFIAFIDKRHQIYIDNRQYGTASIVDSFKKKLLAYNNNKDVLFSHLTYPFISGFVNSLSKQTKDGKYLSQTTIHTMFSRFKTLYNQAVVEDLIMQGQSNPFDKIKVKKGQAHRIGLTEEEIIKITSLDLEKGSKLWHTRNYFLFSMYSAGMRIGDVMNLKWENIVGDRIIYKMRKTKAPASLPIYEKTQNILDHYKTVTSKPTDYIFPILTRYEARNIKYKASEQEKYNQQKSRLSSINSELKEIAKLAGLETRLSFHIARHTFANLASQSDGSVYYISQLLGHSSISITQTYLNGINHKPQDDFLKSVFK